MSFKPRPMRGHNNYDTKQASDEACPSLGDPDYWGPSQTVQSQAMDADINVIMHRFGITGKMPENPNLPEYGHFDQVFDFKSALMAVRHAQESFMEIPANVRAKFNNDPQLFLEFVSDEKNRPEMETLGLVKPRKQEVTNEPTTTAPQPTPNQATTTTPTGPKGA